MQSQIAIPKVVERRVKGGGKRRIRKRRRNQRSLWLWQRARMTNSSHSHGPCIMSHSLKLSNSLRTSLAPAWIVGTQFHNYQLSIIMTLQQQMDGLSRRSGSVMFALTSLIDPSKLWHY